jgi:hypothetical protein
MTGLQTEFSFTLPRGYLDEAGQLHRAGRMRLALAIDEIEAMQDQRVKANPNALPLVLLSRVVTGLEGVNHVTPHVIAGLFASDLVYLEDLYLQLNESTGVTLTAVCPTCRTIAPLQAVAGVANG